MVDARSDLIRLGGGKSAFGYRTPKSANGARSERGQRRATDKVQIHAKCGRIIARTKLKIPSSRRALARRETSGHPW